MPSESKKVDYLTEDPKIPNQEWVCISFLSPENVKNTTLRGIKIRGCFATKEEAEKHAKHLQNMDPDFHIFVGEMGKWLSWDPDPDSIDDQKYREEKLQELMKDYKDNQNKVKEFEYQRRQDILNESVKKESIKQRLRKKLEAKKSKIIESQSQEKVDLETETETETKMDQNKTPEELEEERIRAEINQKINKVIELRKNLEKGI